MGQNSGIWSKVISRHSGQSPKYPCSSCPQNSDHSSCTLERIFNQAVYHSKEADEALYPTLTAHLSQPSTMPEAFTYFDMQRRLERAIPDEDIFTLEIFEREAGCIAIDDASKTPSRSAEIKDREQTSGHFIPHVAHTFPGLDQLPAAIRHGPLSLSGSSIQSRGMALGVPLKDNYWINIHLRMHGHVIAISNQELDSIKEAWETDPDSIKGKINIMLALVNSDNDKQSIIVVDRIKLATLTFTLAIDGRWWSSKQGPCPITQWESFATHFDSFVVEEASIGSIFSTITKRQDYFNGIGTSHANEILHLAAEHPAQKAWVILHDAGRRLRLKEAIQKFFGFAHSDRYQKAVPSGRTGGSAFFEPHYITRNIIALQQRVYGHTKSPTKISKEHYTDLLRRGLLAEKYQPIGTPLRGRQERDSGQAAKYVDVYAIRFLKETKEGEVKDGNFAYTVMCKAPPDSVAVRYEPMEVALRQALGNKAAEIGIASFPDHAPLRHFEQNALRRRFPVKTGKRGRPRKSKDHKSLQLSSSPSQSPLTPMVSPFPPTTPTTLPTPSAATPSKRKRSSGKGQVMEEDQLDEGDLSDADEPSNHGGFSDGEDAGLILDQADEDVSEAEIEQKDEIDASVL